VLTVPNAALRFTPTAEDLKASGLPPTAGRDTTRRARGGTGATGGSGAGGQGGGAFGGGAGGNANQGGGAPGGGAAGGNAGAAGATGRTGGAGGAGGASGRTRRAGTGFGGFGTIWILQSNKKLEPIRVRIGLSDGQRTQVTGQGLSAGMSVVIGESNPAAVGGATGASGSSNPLTPQRGGFGRGGG
jgi:HlyD family secretion protein